MKYMEHGSFEHEINRDEKKRKYTELCGGTPTAIDILSSGIVKTGDASAVYKSGSYADVDPHGLLSGTKGRVVAAAELAEVFPDAMVITNSFYPKDEEGAPTHAAVMGQELNRLGIKDARIIQQKESMSTFTELSELLKMIAENKWQHIVVVTNDFQCARAKEMLSQMLDAKSQSIFKNPTTYSEDLARFHIANKEVLNELESLRSSINFISAEDILPFRSKHYIKLIQEIRGSELYRKRSDVEKVAVEQLKTGVYGHPLKSNS